MPLYKVDLYEDISGKYFPKLEEEDALHLKRKDGCVELIKFSEDGSEGRVVEDHRDRLSKSINKTDVEQLNNQIVRKN
jgi:hypothetical protein